MSERSPFQRRGPAAVVFDCGVIGGVRSKGTGRAVLRLVAGSVIPTLGQACGLTRGRRRPSARLTGCPIPMTRRKLRPCRTGQRASTIRQMLRSTRRRSPRVRRRRPIPAIASDGTAYVISCEVRKKMSNNYQAQASIYAAEAKEAAIRAGPVLVGLVAAGWIAFPFAVQTVLHPGDAILLQYKIQGLWVPRVFTAQQQTVGFIEAVLALAALVMFQLVGTTLFYRREMDGASVATPALWPLACGLACLGNAAWFLGTGAIRCRRVPRRPVVGRADGRRRDAV